MKPKHRIIIYTLLGSTIGSYIPYLWGEINFISFSGIFTSAVGAAIGVFFAYEQNRTIINNHSDMEHKDEEEFE